jgi:malonyl-CoA/methylmalonyl-CoA synthetase
MSNANLYAALRATADRLGSKAALVVGDGTALTYAALSARVDAMHATLVALGVKPGDRVTTHIEKSPDNLVLYLAVLAAGAIYNPLNTAYTPAELDYFLGDAEPALIVTSAKTKAAITGFASAKKALAIETMEPDGSGSLRIKVAEALAANAGREPKIVARQADDLASILYTSGTTGRSKGAEITHGNLLSNARTLVEHWGCVETDVLLHALPIYHVHGLFVALHTALLSGTTILWHAKFDASAVRAALPNATVIMGVPTFYTRLLDLDGFGKADTSRLRLAVSGSAPLLAETHTAFKARTGHAILERYGMTETGMITSNPYRGGDRVAGSVGFALPGVSIRIADADGNVMPDGEVGVLEVKGPNVFKGYWRNPEKTREEFRKDGYFITGDVAVRDKTGRVAIVGRAKDLIISGGFNVYPKEIETEIDAMPGVGESAVIGVPHKDFGEGVVAVVTEAAGTTAPSEAEIITALQARLAKFKVPKRVFVVRELPRNAMGKVQKAELRKTYGTTFS